MITRLFNRTSPLEDPDPAKRLAAMATAAPESPQLAGLVASDPVPEVRAAAAQRCTDFAALTGAWAGPEADANVRTALAAALGALLATSVEDAVATAWLASDACTDAIRGDVACRAPGADRRRAAIAAIRDEEALLEVALNAGQAETRFSAAERIVDTDRLRRLAEAARNKDHGVARLARQRMDAIDHRTDQASKADAIVAELEALAARPGPIVTPLIELDRRWQALDIAHDPERAARGEVARKAIQARFEREQEEHRNRIRFEREVREWIAALQPPASAEEHAALVADLATRREEAQRQQDAAAIVALDEVQARVSAWEAERTAAADAEALVLEAERLAESTTIDNAKLPERWQALDRSTRTPALTRRFEAALLVIEQRRLEQMRAAQEEVGAARQKLHTALHTAEQAFAAGQLQEARTAADEVRALKPTAGTLPKPTLQRYSRLVQQLTEMERWESFGQQNARVQLCERAEALAVQPQEAAKVAKEVQKLRAEWKELDAQHAGVPKALWQRFDHACEQAYAPAARHFAELAGQRKQARKQRDDFIASVALHAPTLITETPDWRAIERWLREIDEAWREGNLGSVDPASWKKLDVKMKAAVAPARDALVAARDKAKAERKQLIDEARELVAKAMERDSLNQIKALQARWQEQAKTVKLLQRDERALWDEFRAACDSVFEARHAKRKEEDGRRSEHRRTLEDVCAQLEQVVASAAEKSDQELRRLSRELQDKWRAGSSGRPDPSQHALEARFRQARAAIDEAVSGRARSREAVVWQSLAAKERLCEALDRAVADGGGDAASLLPDGEWEALPPIAAAWEKKMVGRRDAALAALADSSGSAAASYRPRLERGAAARADTLLLLEMALGLDSPLELNSQRLALQVRQLRDRFQGASAGGANAPGERLVTWCSEPGIVSARDRERCNRIFAAVERLR